MFKYVSLSALFLRNSNDFSFYTKLYLWGWWSRKGTELRAVALLILRSWMSGRLPSCMSVFEGVCWDCLVGGLILFQGLIFENIFPVLSKWVSVVARFLRIRTS